MTTAKHTDRKDARLPVGVTRLRHQYLARVMVAGTRRTHRFSLNTPISEINGWIDEQRGSIRKQAPTLKAVAKGRFEDDVQRYYLPQVRALASYYERKIDIERWAQVFKGRNRNTIKPTEIRIQINAWANGEGTDRLVKHGRTIKGNKLSPSSIKHRL